MNKDECTSEKYKVVRCPLGPCHNGQITLDSHGVKTRCWYCDGRGEIKIEVEIRKRVNWHIDEKTP